MINTEDFDPNLLKIDKKSHKDIGIYYIGYITMKDSDFVKIKNINSLYLHNMTVIIRSVFEEDGQFYSQIYLHEYL